MKSDWWWCFQELEAKFGDKVEVTGEGTPDTTGYLEVIMVVIMVVTVVMVVIVMMGDAYLIFVIFSPRAQFFAKFFSTQKRVNRTKTDFATKQRKLQKNWFGNKIL